jgi:hypothetical protein
MRMKVGMGRGRIALLGVTLAAAVTVTGAIPASAGGTNSYGYLGHTPGVGLHWILDNPGPDPHSPPVTCSYGGSPGYELKTMLIRQPVIFASRSGTQRVGWRALIQSADVISGSWQAYDRTPFSRANATRSVPAAFQPRTVAFPADVEDNRWYRVLYDLVWYGANGTTVVERARHLAYWYLIKGSFRLPEQCPSTNDPLTRLAADPAPRGISEGTHTGRRGLHWILEMLGPYPEYPPVVCEYDSSDDLERLHIRRPIVFARDAGPGVQRQDVGWRAIIQTSPAGGGPPVWTTVAQTSLTRRSATDIAWADLRPKTYVVDLADYDALRVIYRLFWYRGSDGPQVGRADHVPVWYKVEFPSGLGTWREADCLSNWSG